MLFKTTVPCGNLTTAEIQKAKFCLIGHIQKHYHPDEIACLIAGCSVKKSSDIVSLQPYLDDDGLIRVGEDGLHCMIWKCIHVWSPEKVI